MMNMKKKKQKVNHKLVKVVAETRFKIYQETSHKFAALRRARSGTKKSPWCPKETTTCSRYQTAAWMRQNHRRHSTCPTIDKEGEGGDLKDVFGVCTHADGHSGLHNGAVGDVPGPDDSERHLVMTEEICLFHTTAMIQRLTAPSVPKRCVRIGWAPMKQPWSASPCDDNCTRRWPPDLGYVFVTKRWV